MRKKKETIDSFLGKDAVFEGKLSFSGTVKIDGEFSGEISATGYLLVGVDGRVNADIQAASVICSGEIHGKITAEHSIDIRVPGKIYGDIQAPTVVIQQGVIFEGSCRTLTDPSETTGRSGKIHTINSAKNKQAIPPS